MTVTTTRLIAFVGAGLFAVALLTAARPAGVVDRIDNVLNTKGSELIEVFHDLHSHPEVAGQEERTAGVVARRLRALGLEVRTDVGGHGVVGLLRGGKPGPVVAYRADMDAMASTAPDPAPFASENPGVRHICGHDVHTTVGLGIAEVLSAMREDVAGTVKFIFQPAEETAEGAKAMIDDGALADPKPDVIFAVHCAPLPTGQFGSRAGMLLPGLDLVQVTLSGAGDLAAAAQKCAEVVNGMNTTGGMAPTTDTGDDALEAALVPGSFIAAGVFSSEAAGDGWSISAMVRASSEAMHDRARRGIEEGLAALKLTDLTYQLDYTERAIPPVNNDAGVVQRAESVIRDLGGDQAVFTLEETTPFFSEDFSWFQQDIPGAMFFMGVTSEAKGNVGLPHHPMFVADEDAIAVGVRTMSVVITDYLSNRLADSRQANY